ncbi:MAG: hypothetical protein ACXVCH_17780 [Bdellovibrionota bacterium]
MGNGFFKNPLLLSALLIVSGCAGSSAAPLTGEQKVALVGVMRSAMRSLIAVPSDATAEPAATVIPQPGGNDPGAAQMQFQLRTAIHAKRCEMRWGAPGNLTPPASPGTTNTTPSVNGPVAIRVNGGSCPVTLTYTIDHPDADVVTNAQQKLSYSWSYRVQDFDYKKLNDVDSVGLSGTSTGAQNQAGFTTDVRGVLHSQRYGTISYVNTGTVSGTGEKTTGALTTQIVFPAFEADFRMDYVGSKRSFTINGESVDEAEFDSYFPGAVLGPSAGAFGS